MTWLEIVFSEIGARLTGPLSFRFIIQPLVAILLGIRDGRKDARDGSSPIFLNFFAHPEKRSNLLKSATVSILKLLIVGIALDVIAQYLIFKRYAPFEGVLVGSFIIVLPYMLSRALTNRLVSRNAHTSHPSKTT